MPADPRPAAPYAHAATSPTLGPPPPPPPPPPPLRRSGLAVASLWLGIGALLLVVVPLVRLLGLVAAVVGLTLGVVALVGARRARAAGRDESCGRGRAGVALSGVALLLGLVATVSSVVAGVQEGMAGLDAPVAGDEDPAGPWPSAPPPGPSSPGADPFAPALLPVGSAGAVGDYEATVTALTPRTSTLYDPGTESSQTYSYLQVDLVLTNRGPDVAAPLDELQQVVVTADGQHGGTECSRALDVTDASVDEIQPGRTATVTVCVDVPADGALPEQYVLAFLGDEQDVVEGRFALWAVPPPPG